MPPKKPDFGIEALTKEHMQSTIDMLCDVFVEEYDRKLIREHLPASLDDGYITDEEGHRRFVEYYIMSDGKDIVGCIGLSVKKEEEDSYRIGWFGVDQHYRGLGFGKKLISFAIGKARNDGKNSVKVYSSNHPNEREANEMYRRLGFAEVRREKKSEGIEYIYYELGLDKV